MSLIETAPGRTRVEITSTPKTGLLFGGAFDLGKNRSNIEKILFAAPQALGSSAVPDRPCPHCKGAMKRDESTCPHCGTTSTPWVFHAGVWWAQGASSGKWVWADEEERVWRWYEDGTPSDPSATDKTPNLKIDPALVSPPSVPAPESARSPENSSADSHALATEIERLADLHARGVLSDDEFQQAKQRVLHG